MRYVMKNGNVIEFSNDVPPDDYRGYEWDAFMIDDMSKSGFQIQQILAEARYRLFGAACAYFTPEPSVPQIGIDLQDIEYIAISTPETGDYQVLYESDRLYEDQP